MAGKGEKDSNLLRSHEGKALLEVRDTHFHPSGKPLELLFTLVLQMKKQR